MQRTIYKNYIKNVFPVLSAADACVDMIAVGHHVVLLTGQGNIHIVDSRKQNLCRENMPSAASSQAILDATPSVWEYFSANPQAPETISVVPPTGTFIPSLEEIRQWREAVSQKQQEIEQCREEEEKKKPRSLVALTADSFVSAATHAVQRWTIKDNDVEQESFVLTFPSPSQTEDNKAERDIRGIVKIAVLPDGNLAGIATELVKEVVYDEDGKSVQEVSRSICWLMQMKTERVQIIDLSMLKPSLLINQVQALSKNAIVLIDHLQGMHFCHVDFTNRNWGKYSATKEMHARITQFFEFPKLQQSLICTDVGDIEVYNITDQRNLLANKLVEEKKSDAVDVLNVMQFAITDGPLAPQQLPDLSVIFCDEKNIYLIDQSEKLHKEMLKKKQLMSYQGMKLDWLLVSSNTIIFVADQKISFYAIKAAEEKNQAQMQENVAPKEPEVSLQQLSLSAQLRPQSTPRALPSLSLFSPEIKSSFSPENDNEVKSRVIYNPVDLVYGKWLEEATALLKILEQEAESLHGWKSYEMAARAKINQAWFFFSDTLQYYTGITLTANNQQTQTDNNLPREPESMVRRKIELKIIKIIALKYLMYQVKNNPYQLRVVDIKLAAARFEGAGDGMVSARVASLIAGLEEICKIPALQPVVENSGSAIELIGFGK